MSNAMRGRCQEAFQALPRTTGKPADAFFWRALHVVALDVALRSEAPPKATARSLICLRDQL